MKTDTRNADNAPRVLALRLIPGGGKLVASADTEVEIPPFGFAAFNECAVFQGEDGALSVAPPSKPNPIPGRTKYLPLVSWPPDLRRAITAAVSEAYRREAGLAGNNNGRNGGQL